MLILQRHEYYQKFKPITSGGVKFESIIDLGRLYQITTTVQPDGKAVVVWKLRKTREGKKRRVLQCPREARRALPTFFLESERLHLMFAAAFISSRD